MVAELFFWISMFIVFYTYLGYGIILYLLNKFSRKKSSKIKIASEIDKSFTPKVSLIIAVSGENTEIIKRKIENTKRLNYPKSQLEVIFAMAMNPSSGKDPSVQEFYNQFLPSYLPEINSNDALRYYNKSSSKSVKLSQMAMFDTVLSANEFFRVKVTKDIERKGKISQVNRTVKIAEGEIIVFSDANAMFNRDSIKNLVQHFSNRDVGCVAGEKRIKRDLKSTSDLGEGFYWKYESYLKKMDSELWTTVGAAGEIFAVRKSFMDKGIEENAIIEDFVLSMQIAKQGYRVIYEPNAYAEEEPTKDIISEYKRRRRITAGGFQSIVWLKELLNPVKYKTLTFQYVSHRVLRWAVVPFLLPMIFFANLFLLDLRNPIYSILIGGQIIFYLFSFVGFVLELKKKKVRIFNIAFYFSMMNFSAYAGLKRYLLGQQKVVWEKVRT